MGKIIAISGGEIGRPGFKIETEEIDKEIIRLSNKRNPKLLFIPTASNDNQEYIDVINNYFGKRLGCEVDTLYLIEKEISETEIRKKILSSDIIYVGGGNTKKMLEVWKSKNVDTILKKAYEKNIILSGISAGAICWFEKGCSDSVEYKLDDNPTSFLEISGLNFIRGVLCPHFNVERAREEGLENIVKNTSNIGLALDNCVAIEIVGDEFRIIKSKETARVYKSYWDKGKYKKELIENNNFIKLTHLYKK